MICGKCGRTLPKSKHKIICKCEPRTTSTIHERPAANYCVHRGDFIEHANCGCAGKPALYQCKLLDQLCSDVSIGKPGWKHVQACSLCKHRGKSLVRLVSPTILCRLPKPRSCKAVVTIAPDKPTQLELAITGPLMKRYANRIGADFIVIDKLTDQPHKCGNKYAYAEIASRYDQTLWLDSDVVVMDDSPSIFELVRPGQWGGVDDLCGIWDRAPYFTWFMDQWKKLHESLELPLIEARQTWNAGIIVAPNNAEEIYHPPSGFVPADMWCAEQHYLTRRLIEAKADVVSLGREWNAGYWLTDFPEHLPSAHFIHIGGCKPHALRLEYLKHFASGSRDLPSAATVPQWKPHWLTQKV